MSNNIIASDYLAIPNCSQNGDEAIVWIDVETSGDSPETDELLEVGAVITDLAGNLIANEYESLIHVPNLTTILEKTKSNILDMHEKSGLWFDLWNKETFEINQIESSMFQWISDSVNTNTILYFGGNSITLDRNFIRLNLPAVYKRISHRSIDVTSLSIALQSNIYINPFKKQKAHRALLDAKDSVVEYRYYLNSIR